MQSLAREYEGKPPAVAPDLAQVEKYRIMAVTGGSKSAANVLGRMYAEGDILPQDCAKALYYMSIAAQLSKDDHAANEKYPIEKAFRDIKEGFVKGELSIGNTQVIFKPCLTEAEANDIIERSKPAYEAAKAARDKDRAAHDALYEAARKKLPEIKAAYEAAVRERQEGKK